MSAADRIAKDRAKQEATERARDAQQAQSQAAHERSQMLDGADALIGAALEVLTRDRMHEVESFQIPRKLRTGLIGSRGGWQLGVMIGGLGHGETGPIPLYLLTTREFVFGGRPSTTSAVVTRTLDSFSDQQLSTVLVLLRRVADASGPTS